VDLTGVVKGESTFTLNEVIAQKQHLAKSLMWEGQVIGYVLVHGERINFDQTHRGTGLLKSTGNTTHFISSGFWMQGDFCAFLTVDENNKVFLELLVFDQSISQLAEPVLIADSAEYENL
jgi:hypothetical protein